MSNIPIKFGEQEKTSIRLTKEDHERWKNTIDSMASEDEVVPERKSWSGWLIDNFHPFAFGVLVGSAISTIICLIIINL
jgi:hypothetical protein